MVVVIQIHKQALPTPKISVEGFKFLWRWECACDVGSHAEVIVVPEEYVTSIFTVEYGRDMFLRNGNYYQTIEDHDDNSVYKIRNTGIYYFV
jgi:hypothetical protein